MSGQSRLKKFREARVAATWESKLVKTSEALRSERNERERSISQIEGEMALKKGRDQRAQRAAIARTDMKLVGTTWLPEVEDLPLVNFEFVRQGQVAKVISPKLPAEFFSVDSPCKGALVHFQSDVYGELSWRVPFTAAGGKLSYSESRQKGALWSTCSRCSKNFPIAPSLDFSKGSAERTSTYARAALATQRSVEVAASLVREVKRGSSSKGLKIVSGAQMDGVRCPTCQKVGGKHAVWCDRK